jgi:hypothetical protein
MKNTSQFITILFVFLLLVIGCNNQGQNSANTPTPTPENYEVVKAIDIAHHYERNEVQADKWHDGDTIIITGEIVDIGKLITGAPYVILEGKGKSSLRQTEIDVQVIFERSESDKIARLSRGDTIKAKAKCKGLTLGNVVMTDAELR